MPSLQLLIDCGEKFPMARWVMARQEALRPLTTAAVPLCRDAGRKSITQTLIELHACAIAVCRRGLQPRACTLEEIRPLHRRCDRGLRPQAKPRSRNWVRVAKSGGCARSHAAPGS